ncbi:MAG: protein kinase [Gemmatimonadetes bacterium]|nr:protein kinase [Gemmatimonadota bacterium]
MTAPASDPLLQRLRDATTGAYEITRELGRGGFAAVFLARDVELDRDVAIKVLTAQADRDDATTSGEIERFRREARTVAKLNHPNIVPVYAVKAADGLQYFVMKFIKGRSLERVLETAGPLPIALVQTILQQAGSALAFAHRNGVVHRDVKPANIMLDEEGWAVVADFGIAKVARAEKLTGTGLIIGTAAYMSPEQWAGQEVSGQSDQYSLGVVAYELLTGRSPFSAETIPAMLWSHLNEVPPPITELRPDCPEAIARIVARMLEKEPPARFGSLDDVVSALAALPVGEAAAAVRTQLMTLAAVSSAGLEVTEAASGERVLSAGRSVTPSGKVARLTVSPAATSMVAGSTLRLSATPVNDTGKQLARRATAWRSGDERIATVDADGVVTARSAGRTTLVATCEGVEVEVPVTVTGVATGAASGASAGVVAGTGTTSGGRGRIITIAGTVAAIAIFGLWQQGVLGPREPSVATPLDTGALSGDTGTTLGNGSQLGGSTDAIRVDTSRQQGPSGPVYLAPPGPGDGTQAKAQADPRGTKTATATDAGANGPRPQTAPAGPGTGPAQSGAQDAAESKTAPATQPGTTPTTPENTTRTPDPDPDPAPAGNPAIEVSAGGSETCASMSSGDRVLCWGGTAPAGTTLADVYFTELAVGGGHLCGLTAEGAAYCWGDNSQGQLGDGSTTTRATPTLVRSTVRFTDISVGASHTCALGADGSAWCWGTNKAGQLGDNSITNRNRPVLVRGREAFQSLSAGGSHTCGVRASKVYCWGDGFSGQIGNAIQDNQREPFPVRTALPFRSVVTGELHTCGLTTSGRAWCWGENRNGQLGNETHDSRDVPDSVATDLVFTQLAAGARHTCGITNTRLLACWGENGSGQLGDGSRQRREIPVIIARGTQWKKVSTGAAHTCGITRTDVVMCWGANSRGQVGTGAAGTAGAMTLVPTAIKVGPRSGP